MVTVDIRNVPEEAMEALRRRALQADCSLETLVRQYLVDLAARPTTTERHAAVEAALAQRGNLPGASEPSQPREA